MKEHSALLEEKTKMRLELKSWLDEKTRVEERIQKSNPLLSNLAEECREALSSIRSTKEKAVKDEKYSLQALEKVYKGAVLRHVQFSRRGGTMNRS
ncbi:hypothetical protein BSKO_12763 [Bryopsis sp. KO-2023]|nr:hypothetical protein BSKO_12753 [Bryopsis sp. KO-2023]GMH44811.1 hypothetical protein BSKO_12763 [Bryopsis sp. KO-2023]